MSKRKLKNKALVSLFLLLALPGFLLWGREGLSASPPDPEALDLRIEPLTKHPKLESALVGMMTARQGRVNGASAMGFAPEGEKIRVVIEAQPGQAPAAVEAVKALKGEVEALYGDLVQARIPLPALEQLARSPVVRFVRRPLKALPLEIVSEGLPLIGADDWQERLGLTGRGVKIAVLDIGFKGYRSLLGSELPSQVIVKSFRSDGDIEAGETHGTACAEIVHDIAPEAELYLVNFETEVEWGLAVGWLISKGVDVISHSLGWYEGPGDGTGLFSQAVDRARDNGILWVNAAGNSAKFHWSGPWQDGDGDGFLNFTPQDNTNSIEVGAGEELFIFLRWDDPWEASSNDYDLYLLDQNHNVVARSENAQSGFQHPIEWITYEAPQAGTYYIAVKNTGGDGTAGFDLFTFPGQLKYWVAAGSILCPADSRSALAVGAVYWSSPGELEDFSSQGPTRDGRIKPDFVAPDGVSTYSSHAFFGTSAATPHIAGAAGLVKQLHPAFTPGGVEEFLRERALDLGEPGKDNLFGWGRPDLTAFLGNLTGRVRLEGRHRHDGAKVILDGLEQVTMEDGSFAFIGIPEGEYSIEVTLEGYLPGRRTVAVAGETVLPPLSLLGGDADRDGDIDVADLSRLAGRLNTAAPLDINLDGLIDIRDLVLAGRNLGARKSLWE